MNLTDSLESVLAFFSILIVVLAFGSIAVFMLTSELKRTWVKALTVSITFILVGTTLLLSLGAFKESAQIDAVKTASVKNIEQKFDMSNISNVEVNVKDEVVTASAKYMNITDRSTADLTIAFEDSGEPFVLTSEFVTPEFAKTLEK